ncbi:MAG: glutaminyl-peptide cyclotransferase, partial [Myxococcota bacterium]
MAKGGSKALWAGVAVVIAAGAIALAQRSDADPEELEVETVTPTAAPAVTVPEALEVVVVSRHAHDRRAFTQGLLYYDGHLYESTGLEGRSSLRKVDLATGEVLLQHDLEPNYFAEGLARVDGRLFQ